MRWTVWYAWTPESRRYEWITVDVAQLAKDIADSLRKIRPDIAVGITEVPEAQ